MNIVERTSYHLAQGKIDFFNELLHLKSKMELIQPLSYYLKNPEGILIFID